MPIKTKPDQGVIRFRNPILAAGFTQYPNLILTAPELSNGAIRLYGLILYHARQADNAWPGQRRLAAMMGVTTRMLRNHIRELERNALIQSEQRGLNQSNIYWILDIPTKFVRDRKYISDQDRQDISDQDRQDISDKEYADQEYADKNTSFSDLPGKSQPEYDPEFEQAWTAYPKRRGKKLGKAAAYRAWQRLSQEDRGLLLIAINNYRRSHLVAELDAAKDFVRFLKDDNWRDWLTPETAGRPARPGNGRPGLDAADYTAPGGKYAHIFNRDGADG